MDNILKLDAAETVFFKTELESVKSRTYDYKRPELKMRTLVPTMSDANPGAQSIVYYQYDAVGMAKIVESYAKDFPRADVKRKRFDNPVVSLGASYGYSVQDIRSAQMASVPLEQRKANAARLAVMQKEDNLAAFGDEDAGFTGLFNNPNTTEYTLSNPGAGTEFVNKTPDQILADLNGMVSKVIELTNGVESPDTMILPNEQHTYLTSTARSANSDTTIMEYFLSKNVSVRQVEPYYKLKGAGAAGSDRLFMYRRDADHLSLEIPQDFEQMPVQTEGMEYVVYCHQRFGGVIFYYPLATIFADGI